MCSECYVDQKRATPLLDPINCLRNHTQCIRGTCGRYICIERDSRSGLQRWNLPFKSLEFARLYLRTADFANKHSCGIYAIRNRGNMRISYKIFANTGDLDLYLRKNGEKICENEILCFCVQYKEYEKTQVRSLSSIEVVQYMEEMQSSGLSLKA